MVCFDHNSSYINYLRNDFKVTVVGNFSSILGGNTGTSNVYAKQKGASPKDIIILNKMKDKYVRLTTAVFDKDASLMPGSVAAGGIGAAVYLFFDGCISYSFEEIFYLIKLEDKIQWADLVITGEGLLVYPNYGITKPI